MALFGRVRLFSHVFFVSVFGLLLGAVTLEASAEASQLLSRGDSPSIKPSKLPAVMSETVASPASAEDFWTPARMNAAQPATSPRSDGPLDIPTFPSASTSAATGDFTPGNVQEFPQVVHGRVFFTIGSEQYSCSGTLVRSLNRNVVFTAGHCVFDTATKAFVQHLAFVPGYESGGGPLGTVAATSMYTTSQWFNSGNLSYDIGVFLLERPLQDEIGGRRIAFDLNPSVRNAKGRYSPREYTVYGYPAKPTPLFDGETLQGCVVRFSGRDNGSGNLRPYPLSGKPCSMQQGASGGGWIAAGSYLGSVMSYVYCDEAPEACGYIFGPYFSNAAKALYVRAGGSEPPTIKLKGAPPRVVKKRKVSFRFGGNFTTLPGFACKLDRQKEVGCTSRISIARLSPGKHTLRVRAVDQTGNRSLRRIVRSFRVVLPRRR